MKLAWKRRSVPRTFSERARLLLLGWAALGAYWLGTGIVCAIRRDWWVLVLAVGGLALSIRRSFEWSRKLREARRREAYVAAAQQGIPPANLAVVGVLTAGQLYSPIGLMIPARPSPPSGEDWTKPDVPDSMEPIVAERMWRYVWREEAFFAGVKGPLLRSMMDETAWTPGEALVALCWQYTDHQSAPPVVACECGIYLITEVLHRFWADAPWELQGRRLQPPLISARIYGRAEGWGRYQRHSQGWRVQCARPIAFYAPPGDSDYGRIVAEAAELFDVPVETKENGGHEHR